MELPLGEASHGNSNMQHEWLLLMGVPWGELSLMEIPREDIPKCVGTCHSTGTHLRIVSSLGASSSPFIVFAFPSSILQGEWEQPLCKRIMEFPMGEAPHWNFYYAFAAHSRTFYAQCERERLTSAFWQCRCRLHTGPRSQSAQSTTGPLWRTWWGWQWWRRIWRCRRRRRWRTEIQTEALKTLKA